MATDTAPATTNVTPEVPSAFSLFKPSWEGVKLNIVELVMLFVVPTVALGLYFTIAASVAGLSSHGSISGVGIVLLVIGALATIAYAVLLGPAIVHVQIKSARMEKVSYESAWATSKKFWWRYLLLSIAVGLTIFVGLLLLIVPGIIFIRRYFLSQYALIDQDLGLGDSMKASNQLSRGRAMSIFGIIGVDILIGLPSVIPVVGSFITFFLQITYFCAPAVRYDQLKKLKPGTAKATA
jgi:hypothetical protein